jgi:hypothetical protein
MPAGERHCGTCGADRELELSVAGELDPAITSLRRWLLALGAILIVLNWLIYSDLKRFAGMTPDEALKALWPSFALAGGLLSMFVTARMFPLASSLVASAMFVGHWLYTAWLFGLWDAVSPLNVGTWIRGVFLVVLVVAVRAAWRARTLRAQAAENFPTAVARETPRAGLTATSR